MTRKAQVSVFLLVLAVFLAPASAQQPASCSLPAPQMTIHRDNIFNDQQDQWLGDAQADWTEPNYLLLPASKSEYLTKLGEKLLAQLPPTPIHYSFRVFESDEIESFSLAGGHIYVSRKLILDAHNEDELAGVLAHEIGRSTRAIRTRSTRWPWPICCTSNRSAIRPMSTTSFTG